MKVLVVHNRYRTSAPSGEDLAVDAEVALLERGGVEVVRYERCNDERGGNIAAAVETVWSRRARREIAERLRRERPDVVHVHNLWYRISPAAYAACREAGVPVVQTLHNYRMFCANALLLRDGRPCEECVGAAPWPGVRYGCYRSSRLATLPLALSERLHAARDAWRRGVDQFVALTSFARGKFVACGLPAGRITVKPNFLADPPAAGEGTRSGALFVGRLTPEKGVATLLAAASRCPRKDLRLTIAGAGALDGVVGQAAAGSGGRLVATGRLGRGRCLELMRGARCVVVPSVCYENFPLTIVEAFAAGTPVLASGLGAMAELVEDGVTGRLFAPGDAADLAVALTWAEDNPGECARMGRAARALFEERFTAERSFATLTDIYGQVVR